jgi:hypothetical protein
MREPGVDHRHRAAIEGEVRRSPDRRLPALAAISTAALLQPSNAALRAMIGASAKRELHPAWDQGEGRLEP